MGIVDDPRREVILAAAYVQFMRFGYRRTSMEDIAGEAGVSRASLYTHFANKEAIFRGLAESIHERALASAEQGLEGPGSLPDRVEAAFAGKTGHFLEIVQGSPHGAELVDESSRVCGDVAAATDRRFRKRVADVLRAAARDGEVDLAAAGLNAVSAADILCLSAGGLKQGAADAAELRERLHRFIGVFFAGIGWR